MLIVIVFLILLIWGGSIIISSIATGVGITISLSGKKRGPSIKELHNEAIKRYGNKFTRKQIQELKKEMRNYAEKNN